MIDTRHRSAARARPRAARPLGVDAPSRRGAGAAIPRPDVLARRRKRQRYGVTVRRRLRHLHRSNRSRVRHGPRVVGNYLRHLVRRPDRVPLCQAATASCRPVDSGVSGPARFRAERPIQAVQPGAATAVSSVLSRFGAAGDAGMARGRSRNGAIGCIKPCTSAGGCIVGPDVASDNGTPYRIDAAREFRRWRGRGSTDADPGWRRRSRSHCASRDRAAATAS